MFNPLAPSVPGTTTQDAITLFGLATLLADPKKVAQRLTELQEEKNAAHEALQDVEKEKIEVLKLRSDVTAQQDHIRDVLDAHEKDKAALAAERVAFEADKASLASQQQNYAHVTAAFNNTVAEHEKRVALWNVEYETSKADLEARRRKFEDDVNAMLDRAKKRG